MPTVRFLSKRARENLFRAACFQSRRALCATSREAAVALLVLGKTRSRGRRRERSERSPHSLSLWRRSFRRESYLKGEGEQFLLIFEKNCYSPCLLGPFGVRHDCTTKFCHRTNQFLMWFFFSRCLDIQTILFVEIERPCLKEKVKKEKKQSFVFRTSFLDLRKRWAIFSRTRCCAIVSSSRPS